MDNTGLEVVHRLEVLDESTRFLGCLLVAIPKTTGKGHSITVGLAMPEHCPIATWLIFGSAKYVLMDEVEEQVIAGTCAQGAWPRMFLKVDQHKQSNLRLWQDLFQLGEECLHQSQLPSVVHRSDEDARLLCRDLTHPKQPLGPAFEVTTSFRITRVMMPKTSAPTSTRIDGLLDIGRLLHCCVCEEVLELIFQAMHNSISWHPDPIKRIGELFHPDGLQSPGDATEAAERNEFLSLEELQHLKSVKLQALSPGKLRFFREPLLNLVAVL
mmetsp:Transcript_89552/g.187092  ORF Transcript_89552/g.187092 Transcript_89552/m.187092 type:complete len:270 (-) Transcript_89552:201-1010(-)